MSRDLSIVIQGPFYEHRTPEVLDRLRLTFRILN